MRYSVIIIHKSPKYNILIQRENPLRAENSFWLNE
jgi:hypothetical protein